MSNFKLSDFGSHKFNELKKSIKEGRLNKELEFELNQIRNFLEVNRTRYQVKLANLYGSNHFNRALWLVELLYLRSKFDRQYVDFIFLNPVLWFFDSSYYKKNVSKLSENEQKSIKIIDVNARKLLAGKSVQPALSTDTIKTKFKYTNNISKQISVILLCPNPYSIYSLATAELLKRNGVNVAGVVIRNIWSLTRFRTELKFGGVRFVKKIWRKLILRSSENVSTGEYNLTDFLKANNIPKSSLSNWSKNYGVPSITVQNYNESKSLEFVKCKKPDLVVFTGGGLIKESLLSVSGKGVLNCHMGVLPHYKGMDVVQWPLLERRDKSVGLCTHLMVAKIDAGPIIANKLVKIEGFELLTELRNYLEWLMPQFMVESVKAIQNGALASEQSSEGRTYYRMHKSIEAKVLKFKRALKDDSSEIIS